MIKHEGFRLSLIIKHFLWYLKPTFNNLCPWLTTASLLSVNTSTNPAKQTYWHWFRVMAEGAKRMFQQSHSKNTLFLSPIFLITLLSFNIYQTILCVPLLLSHSYYLHFILLIPGAIEQFWSVFMDVLRSPLELIPPPEACRVCYVKKKNNNNQHNITVFILSPLWNAHVVLRNTSKNVSTSANPSPSASNWLNNCKKASNQYLYNVPVIQVTILF